MARFSSSAFLAAALLFIVVPGHPDAWFGGLPVGLWTLVILALIAFAWGRPQTTRPNLTRAMAAIAILVVAKLIVAALAPATGWLGRYYANGDFTGEPRQSTEFARLAGATRIDRAIDFRDDYLPLYFLNEADFNRGMRREVTESVSVEWTGHVQADAATPLRLAAETRGTVRVAIDGTPVDCVKLALSELCADRPELPCAPLPPTPGRIPPTASRGRANSACA